MFKGCLFTKILSDDTMLLEVRYVPPFLNVIKPKNSVLIGSDDPKASAFISPRRKLPSLRIDFDLLPKLSVFGL